MNIETGNCLAQVHGKGGFMEFKIGDIVKLKKPHPCGSSEWEVVRVGMDFKVPRKLVEKNCRGIR